MRSKIAKKIASETSEEEKVFMKLYADIVVRVNKILEENKMTRQTLASMLGKNASEVSKWLNGDHNLTLLTIAKLHLTLGETIISVPNVEKPIEVSKTTVGHFSVNPALHASWKKSEFKQWERNSFINKGQGKSVRKEYQDHDICQAA